MRVRFLAISIALIFCIFTHGANAMNLEQGFRNPPQTVKPKVYWWWLYNRVDKAGITRDLEQFKAKGITGVNLICTGGYAGLEPLPGVKFLGPEWRELFRHMVKEAKRLKVEVGFNLAGGWVMIGPWVTPDNAMKKAVQSQLTLAGPQLFKGQLPKPEVVNDYYHDVWVQAVPGKNQPVDAKQIVDLTSKLKANGSLEWDVPKGDWTIIRTGYTLTGSRWDAYPNGDTFDGGQGYQIDYLSTRALDDHFNHLGRLVLDEAKKAGGKLDYLWSDSWECGKLTWTQDFPAQFKRFRGYDLKPYMPVLSGHTVVNADVTKRFLADYDRTIQDCLAENFYGHFAELCHKNGVRMGNEAAGPGDIPPMDSLRNLGRTDIPTGEFWMNDIYKFPGGFNLNLKQTASAAHTYGKKLAMSESFTQQEGQKTHWYYGPDDFKPFGDQAFCEGINQFMLHCAVCQLSTDGKPGYEFCAGQHWDTNITWWPQIGSYLDYLSRCQYLLQKGRFVADICFYLGEEPPIIAPPKHDNPALGWGYDSDYCNAEVLVKRMSVKDDRIVLPDGMSYKLLVLQNCTSPIPDIANRVGGTLGLRVSSTPALSMSVEVATKIRALVMAGATVIGPKPVKAVGLTGYPLSDVMVRKIADEVWGDCDGKTVLEHRYGKGRVIWGKTPKQVLEAEGIGRDFRCELSGSDTKAVWIWHAADGENPPEGTRYFKSDFTLDDINQVSQATIDLAADNEFQLWVNGTPVSKGDSWSKMVPADLKAYLQSGTNQLLIRAKNTAAGPAGLCIRGSVMLSNGKRITFDPRDVKWESSEDQSVWTSAQVLGEDGVKPWGPVDIRLPVFDYIHRRENDKDIYFVTNLNKTAQSQVCSFRVCGKQPEFWDAMTGKTRLAKAFTQSGDKTVIPIELAPHESVFVVFQKPISSQMQGTDPSNSPKLSTVATLSNPWTVKFDTKWGGPESSIFPNLVSWTERPEEGIKFFSGKATYSQTFDFDAHTGKTYLDLGRVKHVAQIRLNGKDLGVLWTFPWRVEVTGLLKAKGNVLEIDVINLWANRVIGDLALPKEKRLTTTHDGFRFDMITKDTPLVESGLLGPVRILKE
jgi:hypothetical protein